MLLLISFIGFLATSYEIQVVDLVERVADLEKEGKPHQPLKLSEKGEKCVESVWSSDFLGFCTFRAANYDIILIFIGVQIIPQNIFKGYIKTHNEQSRGHIFGFVWISLIEFVKGRHII